MTIYQIHEYSDGWDNTQDYIVGSYLHKKKAKAALVDFEKAAEVAHKESLQCQKCAIWKQDNDDITEKEIAEQCSDLCDRFDKEDTDDGSFDCRNWAPYYGRRVYRIEEVEVIE